MASRRKRSASDSAVAASGSKRLILISIREEDHLPSSQSSDICTHWPANPNFDPKRGLLRRMFFFNEEKAKYMS